MKKVLSLSFLLLLLVSSFTLLAQEDKSKRPSPPATLNTSVGDLNIVVDYSQPAVKGRSIGKELAPYGKVWRTGANEATTFTINRDAKIEGKELKAGKYSLFTIPGEDEWTIIFNKVADQWGAYEYDEKQDALRVKVKPAKAAEFAERLTFSQADGKLQMHWGNTAVRFSVE